MNITSKWQNIRLMECSFQASVQPQNHLDYTLSKRLTKYINAHMTMLESDDLFTFIVKRILARNIK